jgi:polysaccharide export outer membrane protein
MITFYIYLARRYFQSFKAAFVVALIVASRSNVHAQCPAESNPDSLGCAVVLDSSSQLNGSPASVNIEGAPDTHTPHPDDLISPSSNTDASILPKHIDSPTDERRSLQRSLAARSEPLTEFQRFVAASIGQTLPVYGADLFNSTPAAFGPLDHGPSPQDMIVGIDDELRLRVWGQVNFSSSLRVSREGEIYIPKVGAVHVAGLPFSAVPDHVRNAMERVYRNFELTVDMGEIHSIQIYVTGLAHRPGEYTVSALSMLIDAVFASGGPAAAGSMRHILLKRAGKTVTDFDLYALLVNGEKTGDAQLQPGDVLYFPAAGAQVAVFGSVRQPAIYELRGRESIQNLLDAAGGQTSIAAGAHLSVERIEGRSKRRAFEVGTNPEGLVTILSDGDILHIDPVISTYRETVTLRGAVANPGHYQWHEGMHLSELMPDRDSVVRRDYWWHRTQLGLPAAEFLPSTPKSSQIGLAVSDSAKGGVPPQAQNQLDNQRTIESPHAEDDPTGKPSAVESPERQTNWNYAVIERLDSSTMRTSLIPFGLGKLILEHDASQDLELMAGDVVTIFAQSEIQIPANEQTKYITLEGEFVHPGIYSVSAGETLRSVVSRAGGVTQQAYLYAASFTRTSTQALEQQHLNEFSDQLEHQLLRNSMFSTSPTNGATSQQALSSNRELIERMRAVRASGRIVLDVQGANAKEDELPDLHLENGDHLLVPVKPDTVQVLGAVFNSQAFIFHPGIRAGEYLHLAGGPNRDADRKRIFILGADGTVTSSDSQSSFSRRGLGEMHLHPGDSIVVPEKGMHLSGVAQVLAWTQAISQASLPAVEATSLTH